MNENEFNLNNNVNSDSPDISVNDVGEPDSEQVVYDESSPLDTASDVSNYNFSTQNENSTELNLEHLFDNEGATDATVMQEETTENAPTITELEFEQTVTDNRKGLRIFIIIVI